MWVVLRVLEVKEEWERGDEGERLRFHVKELAEVS